MNARQRRKARRASQLKLALHLLDEKNISFKNGEREKLSELAARAEKLWAPIIKQAQENFGGP